MTGSILTEEEFEKEIEEAAMKYGRAVAHPQIRSMWPSMSRGVAAEEFGNSYKKGAKDFVKRTEERVWRECMDALNEMLDERADTPKGHAGWLLEKGIEKGYVK